MELRLDGKKVLLTAGGAGIGRVTIDMLCAAGAKVVTSDIDEQALEVLRMSQPEVLALKADMGDRGAIDRLFDQALSHLQGLDILINNAGIAGPTAPVEEVDPDEWQETLDVNITGQFLCCRRAVPALKQAGGGAIINLSSAAGRLGFPLRTPYAASKWAVVGLTKSLAIELGPSQIRVNAICPGSVEGPRIERVIAAKAAAQKVSYEQMHRAYAQIAAMGRMVTPQDVAAMIVFLCSDAARLVSGQVIGVDGQVDSLR